jgi:hypothetical protein
MISNIGGWDEKLVQNQFLPEDANAILSIRSVIGWRIILLGTLTQKKHFWRNQPTIWGPAEGQKARATGGMLEQKHRGQCCQTQLEENLGSASTQQIMFVWRLTHNILASRMKIMRLGVDLDIACPFCTARMEARLSEM